MEKDITGKRFGMLVALRFDHKVGKRSYWLFKCDCGKEKVILKGNVLSGKQKACGCQMIRIKHGLTHTRLHHIWIGMKSRCYDKNKGCYRNYGGKGVRVCDTWKKDFKSFYKWSMENGYKDNLTIDRIDSKGDYCPENCRWVTRAEQNRNTNRNLLITYKGETLCLREIARKYGIHWATVSYRLKKGKPLDEVFSKKGTK